MIHAMAAAAFRSKTMSQALRLSLAVVAIGLATAAQAGVLLVAGSPSLDEATGTGLKNGGVFVVPDWGANDTGTAVGFADKYVSNTYMGDRAVRWDASSTTVTELGDLGTDSTGVTNTYAYAINNDGTTVGSACKYVNNTLIGLRAARWDVSGTTVTELGNLGTDSTGYTVANARAVNDAGTAVGYANKYVSNTYMGWRAVRWDASGTVATELGNLGTDSTCFTDVYANAVNDAGTAVGQANKYVNNTLKGNRAVRWDASGTVATELGDLGTDNTGFTAAGVWAVNNTGTAVGTAEKYVSNTYMGWRAARWDASGTVATELGNLGTASTGYTVAFANAINNVGMAVGYSLKYLNNANRGMRAVCWDASGTTATELGNLGIDSTGLTFAYAYAVNDAGAAVGRADKYVNNTYMGDRAVIWLPDASAVDLNDLGVAPVPTGGTWTLIIAKALSADGWVAGEGKFDPDGAGPLASYTRLWVSQVGLGGTWTKASGGTWGRGPNWSTGTPAMQVGNATFDLNSAYTVALDRDERTKSMAISAGTVTIEFNDHTLATENGMSIARGATLQAAGAIVSDILNSGVIYAGNSPGKLNITGSLANTGTLEFEIASLLSHGQIELSGDFTAGGTIALKLAGYAPVGGDRFDLMHFGRFLDDGYAFDFSQAGLSDGLTWDTSSFATTGAIDVVTVPEPSAIALLGMGVVGLLGYGWRRRK